MRKHFCDRCGIEIPDGTMHWMRMKETFRRVIFFTPVGMSRDVEAPKEICENCQNSFYNWWSNGDPVKCVECKYSDWGTDEDGKVFLKCLGWVYGGTGPNEYCSHAERREKE